MICENGYILKTNSGNKEFDSDIELDAYINDLLKLYPNIVDISDFVTRSVDFQKGTIDILDEISKKVSSVSRLITYNKDDIEVGSGSEDAEDVQFSYYKIDNSIGVNRFLQKFNLPSTGELFTVPFNKES